MFVRNAAPAPDAVPTSVDKWYDRHSRSWVVSLRDADGNQLGDAAYAYSRHEADLYVAYLEGFIADRAAGIEDENERPGHRYDGGYHA